MRRVGATYIQGVSEAIKRVLQRLGIALCHKPGPIQWLLCNKMKDEFPPKKRKGVVYEVPCDDCELTYVGETLRTIENRSKEHKRCVERGDTKASAIVDHVGTEDHRVDFQK